MEKTKNILGIVLTLIMIVVFLQMAKMQHKELKKLDCSCKD